MSWLSGGNEEVLAAIDETVPSPSGWYRVTCPFCAAEGHETKEKKLSVNADTGYFMCWRAKCGARGFVKLDEAHLARRPKKAETKPSDGRVPLPEEYLPIGPSQKNTSISLRPYLKYLSERGLTDLIIEEARLGVALSGRYACKIIVPVFSGGTVAGFTSRSIAEKIYMNPPGFLRTHFMLNGDALQEETDEPIVIVEGPFDCLRHWPYAVGCFGKPTMHHVQQIRRARRPVVIGLDADAQMEGWGLALQLEVLGMDVKFLKLKPGYDPGKTPHEEFMERVLSAKKASSTFPDVYSG